MDHRALKNLIAFLLGVLLISVVAVASAATSTWYRVTTVNGGNHNGLQLFVSNRIPATTAEKIAVSGATSRPASAQRMMDAITWPYISGNTRFENPHGAVPAASGSTTMFVYVDCILIDSGNPCSGSIRYVALGTSAYTACDNGLPPVDGQCPEDNNCTGANIKHSGDGLNAPASICVNNCERLLVGNSDLALPLIDKYFADYYYSGEACSETNVTPTPLPQRESPTTETTTTAPTTQQNPQGDPETTTETTTTTTTPPGVEYTEETDIIEYGETSVERTTTTKTTTHADGSTTVETTTSYSNTTPDSFHHLSSGGTWSSEFTQGSTASGGSTTTTTINPDGSSSTTTNGEGEDSEGTCGRYVPTFICDWFKEPTLEPAPEVPTIESAPGSYSSGLPSSGSCPAGQTVSLGFGSHTLSYEPFCDLADLLRPFVIAISYLMGAFIVVGGRGK
jgi:hypothetical protein